MLMAVRVTESIVPMPPAAGRHYLFLRDKGEALPTAPLAGSLPARKMNR